MQIRHLKVSNFRGISTLDWKPDSPFCCLIGAGDSGKSTLLDAAEAALSSRWFSFTEPDFMGSDTSQTIVIEATIGELSKALKSDERLGLYIRGWTAAGDLRDEPEGDDEPVLTVRLTVDDTIQQRMRDLAIGLGQGDGVDGLTHLFALSRRRSRWKLFRNELWRDAERATTDLAEGRADTMTLATQNVRQRFSNSGRKLPKRTVSTPLLLKGLEFDHVVIPNAIHFANERQAQAKLFYVAISRATRSLTISSPERVIRFAAPLY